MNSPLVHTHLQSVHGPLSVSVLVLSKAIRKDSSILVADWKQRTKGSQEMGNTFGTP
jgi:hypothetical protein